MQEGGGRDGEESSCTRACNKERRLDEYPGNCTLGDKLLSPPLSLWVTAKGLKNFVEKIERGGWRVAAEMRLNASSCARVTVSIS